MSFKKGDIVMVVDPTKDWPEKYHKNVYGIYGEVLSVSWRVHVRHIHVYDGKEGFGPDDFGTSPFMYHPEVLEKLPAMNVED